MAGRWRTGRSVGRTLYEGDDLIGLMDTPALAERVVAAVNARDRGAEYTVVRTSLLHEVDGVLSLAVYRHDDFDDWMKDAKAALERIRTLTNGRYRLDRWTERAGLDGDSIVVDERWSSDG